MNNPYVDLSLSGNSGVPDEIWEWLRKFDKITVMDLCRGGKAKGMLFLKSGVIMLTPEFPDYYDWSKSKV